MAALDTPESLLSAIHKRPAMFFGGDGKNPFTKLVAFLDGYKLGYETALARSGVTPSELVPVGFNQFVAKHVGVKPPVGGRNWVAFIVEKTRSEEEAFELFFRLRQEYEQEASSHRNEGKP